MKLLSLAVFLLGFVLATPAAGQRLSNMTGEAGLGGAGSFYNSRPVQGARGEARAGFRAGPAGSAWIGHDMYARVGGEFRYAFGQNHLRLRHGGSAVSFKALSHAVHYDLLVYATPRNHRVRPFAAVGAGVKGYQGTGSEAAYQPLQEFALLTRTSQWKPMLSLGGGLKFAMGRRAYFRFEVRDYLTPFPEEVITPSPGNRVGGWVHNLTPLAGVGFRF